MQKRSIFTALLVVGEPVSLRKNQETPSSRLQKNIPLPHNGGRHLCHLTSALSLQQDSVRLRRCGSRRHLRGRIALQANLSLQPAIPGLQPEVTHSIAFQAKIVLLSTG